VSATSIVIASWNTRELLRACLAALARSRRRPREVIVVDDASGDGSADMVEREFPHVVLVRRGTRGGFAPATNAGLARASGEYVLLLNADTEVDPDALGTLESWLAHHPEYAAAAPRLVNPDGSTQRACMRFPSLWTPLFFGTPLETWFPKSRELERYFLREFDHEHAADVEQPPAACLLLRRTAVEQVGRLDERLALFFNDVDLSKRLAAANLRTRYLPDARVLHHVGASTRQRPDRLEAWHADRLAYYRKHHGRLAGLWVKLCCVFAWSGWVATQLARRLARRPAHPAEPLGPVTRSLVRLLAS
jgi:GT2 family glycosyltransferase